ncbi:MAG: class I SAM-dependent methyltransferase [Alphaproteobacteria bacterium]|nr:class I SAM-dependent methyltransferase [Alphaproteobacteria bacterium]
MKAQAGNDTDVNILADLAPVEAAEVPDSATINANLEEYFEWRRETLKDIPYKTVRKAWFTLSHLLLPEGAYIADIGCDDGMLTFCMAALAPKLRFIGIDKSKRAINKARQTYELHNLEFRHGDAALPGMGGALEDGSVDAVVNAFVLHEVFSDSRYSEQIVSDSIKNQFRALKTGGLMLIHDYARIMPEEFALLEFPDKPSTGEDLAQLSEADLLVWYSEQARSKQDPGCGGFFLEELPPRRPRTRLFRLPFKWAYEFIMRKDDRKSWESALPTEFTYFTMREFRQELRNRGARVQYSAPLWDEEMIEEKFEGSFRLLSDDGKSMGPPPTSFIALATKLPERRSLLIEERRPSAQISDLKISLMRNEQTGALTDVVVPKEDIAEMLPYRISDEGRLKIYLHDGVARGIVNTVPRTGLNIDGKRWSGHMVEAISVDENALSGGEAFDFKQSVLFARDYLGLMPRTHAVPIHGPDYYPAPDFIDERIATWYLDVEKPSSAPQPRKVLGSLAQFQSKGEIREFDAQQILNAISVGMIPNARLELQVLSLFNHLQIPPENWIAKDIAFEVSEITSNLDVRRDLLSRFAETDNRFKEIKGTAGQLRAIHSNFVEEGQAGSGRAGLHAGDLDFVIPEEKTVNIALVVPFSADIKKDVHAGFLLDHLPVPQRHEGNGLTASVPAIELPPEIREIKQMKKFIAEKFGVLPDMVFKLGESYYTHLGVSPQRVYPFGVACPPNMPKDPNTFFYPIAQFRMLWGSIAKSVHFMTVLARGFKYMQPHIKAEYRIKVNKIMAEQLAGKAPDWSVPISYEPPPRQGRPGADR